VIARRRVIASARRRRPARRIALSPAGRRLLGYNQTMTAKTQRKPATRPAAPRKPEPKDLEIIYRAVDDLIPYARNSRTHSAAQVSEIAGSIREFGFTNPVLVDEKGTIIAGHARVLAARQLAMPQVPTIALAHLSETQRRAYVIADNRLALNAGWDSEMLRAEMIALDEAEFDVALTGFSQLEIEAFYGEPVAADDQWNGMPEFEHEDQTSAHRVIVHFASTADLAAFAQLVGQTVTEHTRSIWYPKAEIGRYADKRYAAGEAPEPAPADGA
jgi:hypothetical protein